MWSLSNWYSHGCTYNQYGYIHTIYIYTKTCHYLSTVLELAYDVFLSITGTIIASFPYHLIRAWVWDWFISRCSSQSRCSNMLVLKCAMCGALICISCFNQQRRLEEYIADTLQVRLNWLLSGSRVPFGVITEQRSENNSAITSVVSFPYHPVRAWVWD